MPRQDSQYLRVFEALKQDIERLGPNVLLPSEHDLARRFDVSRVTIRRAVGLLERSGLVTRQPGRGTFVNLPKISRRLAPVISLEEDLADQGIKFETRILQYDKRAIPPDFVRERLAMPRRALAGFLSLARLVDGRVFCHDRHYFPTRVASRFNPSMILDRPVSRVLRGLLGAPIRFVDWETEIVPASQDIAAVLGITSGALIVLNTGTEFLRDQRPLQVNIMAYRIDRVRFKFAMRYGIPVR